MDININIVTSDVVETSNKVSFQWVVGRRIYDEIINNLRIDDFVGVLVINEFAELSGENKKLRCRTSKP